MNDVVYPPKPLTLSASDANALELLADQLVAETLLESDEFISRGRAVDRVQWKILKKKNNTTAYRARKCAPTKARRTRIASEDTETLSKYPQQPEFYPITDKNIESELHNSYLNVSATCPETNDFEDVPPKKVSIEDFWGKNTMEKSRPEHVPMVFCTGSVPGTVEDAAMGFLADSEARTRERISNGAEAHVKDVKILAHIQGPTFDDPFRFLGVKWWTQSASGAAGRFIKPRDFLVIESSGMALDSDGERFCYLLRHSIELDEVSEFRRFGFVRPTLSACHIVRPRDIAGEVEVFCRGFTDSFGSLTERVSTHLYCDELMSVPQMIEEAYTRKLVWLLQTEPRRCNSLCPAPACQNLDTCQSCSDNLNRGVGKLFDYSICVLCRHSACRKCTVKRVFTQETGESKLLKKTTVKFCLKCYLEAKNLPAWQVGINSLSVTEQE